MNKLGYIILSFCCALTLILGWVVYGQSREIGRLEQTVTKLDDIREQNELEKYWQMPTQAFLKSSIEGLFTMGFNDYERILKDAHQYFYSDEAYQQYLKIIDQLKIIEPMKENLTVIKVNITQKPTTCEMNEYNTYSLGQVDGKCLISIDLMLQSGTTFSQRQNIPLEMTYTQLRDSDIKYDFRILKIALIKN